jgi:predicted small secreted protein
MKKSLFAIATLSLALALNAGCHTVQGAGKDLQTAGEKGQNAIDPAGQK